MENGQIEWRFICGQTISAWMAVPAACCGAAAAPKPLSICHRIDVCDLARGTLNLIRRFNAGWCRYSPSATKGCWNGTRQPFFQLPANPVGFTRRIDRHEASLERDGSRRCAGARSAGVGANKRADDSVISRRTVGIGRRPHGAHGLVTGAAS